MLGSYGASWREVKTCATSVNAGCPALGAEHGHDSKPPCRTFCIASWIQETIVTWSFSYAGLSCLAVNMVLHSGIAIGRIALEEVSVLCTSKLLSMKVKAPRSENVLKTPGCDCATWQSWLWYAQKYLRRSKVRDNTLVKVLHEFEFFST